MRRETRIGLAVGGAVLLVVVLLLLVTSGSKPQPTVVLNPDGDDPLAITPSTSVPTARDSAARDASAGDTSAAAQGDLDWAKLLSGEQPLPLMSQTPVPVRRSNSADSASSTTAAPGAAAPETNISSSAPTGASTTAIESATAGASGEPSATATAPGIGATPPGASTAPGVNAASTAITRVSPDLGLGTLETGAGATSAAGGSRTHVIQPGETLSSISLAAYGSANYWPHIARANPSLDPNRLRPGTTISLPDVTRVRPESPGDASRGTASPATSSPDIDPAREYRVQAGDSLYRISSRLYGRSDYADRIYELNKEAIGPDMGHIRVGMVLKLPESPRTQ